MESIFGEPAILSQVSYQEKIRPDPNHLKMHSDFDGGILVFYYLSGVDEELGCTRYLPEYARDRSFPANARDGVHRREPR